MDEQLPELENFKAIPAEPEAPEPWWKRYYAYLCYCVVMPVVAAGYELLAVHGLGLGEDKVRELSRTMPVEEVNQWILSQLLWAGLFGLGGAVSLCFSYETYVRFKTTRKP